MTDELLTAYPCPTKPGPYTARSASDKRDDWPNWYVAGPDGVTNYMTDLGGYDGGRRCQSMFAPREDAEMIASAWNRRADHSPDAGKMVADHIVDAAEKVLTRNETAALHTEFPTPGAEPTGTVSEADIDAMLDPALTDRLAESMRRDSPVTMGLGKQAKPAGDLVERVAEAIEADIAEAIGTAYDCIRAWEAWWVGTMRADDFHSITDNAERMQEISTAAARAAIALFKPQLEAAGELLRALERVDEFIINGIELGFIRMPDKDVPDPAHKTPGIVRAAIATAKNAGIGGSHEAE